MYELAPLLSKNFTASIYPSFAERNNPLRFEMST